MDIQTRTFDRDFLCDQLIVFRTAKELVWCLTVVPTKDVNM